MRWAFSMLFLGLFKLAVENGDGVDGGLFVLPLGLELGGLLLEIGQVLFDFFQPLARGFVLFLAQSRLLDFELHDLALELVDFRGHGIQFHAQARSRFVHQVNGFIGQKTVGDIAVGKRGGGDQGGVLNANRHDGLRSAP